MSTTRPARTGQWNTRPLFSHPARPGGVTIAAAARAALYAWGGDSGYSTEGDVLVNKTADGVDLNAIWEQTASAMSLYNRERSALAALISYPTTQVGDAIPQQIATWATVRSRSRWTPTGTCTRTPAIPSPTR
ncbi:hypothetical protein QLG13_08515 [Rhodococcus aetherivorans]|uniref:hypothetical protein n=1 Tax=Rhodococcus aetherivorans TaxID=191292 RepID=UPI0021A7F8C7|nr:hypothetical protein [Rhodococcus aetherivorans]